ncbi:MAG: PAS domain S-box protein [Chloroflexi bacterium]|nr:PAS domain S-box protein [Chloroflexota bacterium]
MVRKKQPAKKETTESANDITGRKKTEDALSRSAEQYRLILETAGEAILVVQDLKIKFFNHRAIDLTGYSAAELKDMPFANLVYPDDLELLADGHRRRLKGEPFEHIYPFRYVLKGGRVGWVEISTALIDWEGKPATLSFLSDITERKRIEDALREREDQLSAYLDNAPDGVYMYDLESKFLYVNRWCEEITGYKREELIGNSFMKLNVIAENSLARATELFQDNKNGKGTGPDELELVRKDGCYVPVEINTSIVQRGGEKVALAFIRDISERKKVEIALRESEERFRRLSENAPDVIYRYSVKPDWRFEYISPVVAKLTGYIPEEFYADPLLGLKLVHPEDKDIYKQHFRNIELFGVLCTHRWMHKDGRVIWTERIDVPVYNENGEFIAIEGVIRDISQRKQVEQAARESESLYRLLSEHMTDTVFLMNMDLKPTYLSPSVQRARGFTAQEIMEMPLEENLTPETYKVAAEAFLEEMAKLEANPDYDFKRTVNLEYYRKDGTTFWSENTFSLLRDNNGKPISILGEGRDVTERRKAEEALRQSEYTYHLLAEHMSNTVWMTDMDLNITWLSPSAVKARGYSLDEIYALPLDRQMTPESLGELVRAFEKYTHIEKKGQITQPSASISLELEFYCKDGHIIVADCTFQFLRDEQGKATGILAEARGRPTQTTVLSALWIWSYIVRTAPRYGRQIHSVSFGMRTASRYLYWVRVGT